MAIVEMKDLDFTHNGEPVVEDVNLTVQLKDFMAIIGANGGKTTLQNWYRDYFLPAPKGTQPGHHHFGCQP